MDRKQPLHRTKEIADTAQDMAPYLEDLYEKEELKEETLQLIVFRLVREWYGVEITGVREVIKVCKITYLPSSPEYIAGIVSFRGNILSVTDLKTLFHLSHQGLSEKTRIIVVQFGIFETGLLADEVVESIHVPLSRIEPPLFTLPTEGAAYVKGQFKVGDKLIGLVSVEKILEKKA